jgi:2-dehydropantoate 2-reductase
MVRAGEDVTFVDVVPEHVAKIRTTGLEIQAFNETFRVTAPAVTPDELKGPLECVLLATKAHHTMAALEQIKPLLAPDGFVVLLQNGLNQDEAGAFLGRERTVCAFINFSADYLEPGVIFYGGPGAFWVGEIDAGPVPPRVEQVVQRLRAWGDVHATDNIWGFLWGKEAYGAMLDATALTNEPGRVAIDQARGLMVGLACEVLAVCEGLGVKAEGFDCFEPEYYYPVEGRDEAQLQASLDRLVARRRMDKKTHTGTWRDLAIRKRKTQIDADMGPVLDAAARLGIQVPLLHGLVDMIHEIEDGKREICWENLAELAARKAPTLR